MQSLQPAPLLAPWWQVPTSCADADPVCRIAVRSLGPEWGPIAASLASHVGRIVLVLVLAVVISKVARSAIRRVVGRVVRAPGTSPGSGSGSGPATTGPSGTVDRTPPGGVDGAAGTGEATTATGETRALPDPLRRSQRAKAIGQLLSSIVTVVVWTVATLEVLAELGLNLAPLLAGAGIAGVAIGFGAQNLVRDVISGVFMLLEDQYGVGDIIDVGSASGTVERVRLRSTQLRDISGVVWHVPNGEIKRVGNKSQQWSRAVIDVRVGYDVNLDEALVLMRAVAFEVYREDPVNIIEEPEVAGVEEFGTYGAVLPALVKTLPAQQWAVQRTMRARIKTAFDQAGIHIPYLYTPEPAATSDSATESATTDGGPATGTPPTT